MNMRAYLAIVRLRFLLLLQYRIAALAGLATQFVFGFIFIFTLEAFYISSTAEQPMSFDQIVTYVWLGQAMLSMLPWNGDGDVQTLIRSGNVAYELCRPTDLYNQWYARAIALRTAPTLLRAIPLFIVTVCFLPDRYSLSLPQSAASFFAWIMAQFGALLLGCAITNLMNVSLLWTISGDGVNRVVPALVTILSGMVIPLPLFPDWCWKLLQFLPFAGLVDTPFRFFIGHIPPSEIWIYLLRQLTWTMILVGLGRRLLARGLKRVVVQGG